MYVVAYDQILGELQRAGQILQLKYEWEKKSSPKAIQKLDSC